MDSVTRLQGAWRPCAGHARVVAARLLKNEAADEALVLDHELVASPVAHALVVASPLELRRRSHAERTRARGVTACKAVAAQRELHMPEQAAKPHRPYHGWLAVAHAANASDDVLHVLGHVGRGRFRRAERRRRWLVCSRRRIGWWHHSPFAHA